MTKLPRMKLRGTSGEVQQRAKERALVMEKRHPGVHFSLCVPNPLGLREARGKGIPGTGLPQAILNLQVRKVQDPQILKDFLKAYQQWKAPGGYIGYVNLKEATGFSYAQVFGVVLHLRASEPYESFFSVNRLGDSVYFKYTG